MKSFLGRTGGALVAPIVAVLIAVLFTSLVILASGSNSGVTGFWQIMLSSPSHRVIVNIVNLGSELYISAVAAAIGFRMGLFNIGVEGQYGLAAYTAATFAGAALLPGPLNVLATILVAMGVGAAWAGIAGVLRVTRGVSEVISTIMLNAIGPTLVGYLLNRYGEKIGNGLTSKQIQGSSTVAGWTPFDVKDGQIWTLDLLAIVVGVAFWVVLNKTRFGFDLRAAGRSASAARASGVDARKMTLVAMLASGGVAGLIWMPDFFGSSHSFTLTFQAGLGFTGIAVALLGRNDPLGMVFGAALFSWLSNQSTALEIGTDIDPNVIQVTQGVAVLAVVIAYEIVRRQRTRREQQAVAAATTEPAEVLA